MNAAVDFVGVEPEGLRLLALSLEAAEADLSYATAGITALLDEAGEAVDVPVSLRAMADEWNTASADIRRRAVLAEDYAALAAAPRCEIPWWDPLRRAARAVAGNVWQFANGTFDTYSQSGSTVWRLTPVNGQWRQEWVDLRAGLGLAVDDPGDAWLAWAGTDDLENEGWSYWLGGVVPDLALSAFGGAGLINRSMRATETLGDMAGAAEAGGRLNRLAVASAAATRRGIVEGDNPLGPRLLPDPAAEREARTYIVDLDRKVGGHHASKHGPETTLEQQRRRALTGINPDGTRGRRPENSSRFLRWEDQRAAVARALELWNGVAKSVRVPFDHTIGEGFMKETGDYRETAVATVKFSPGGVPYTSFPELKEGR